MKKTLVLILLVVFFCSGCSAIKELLGYNERTPEYLLDTYIEGYLNSDLKKATTMYPQFVLDSNRQNFTQEALESALKHSKEEFGDDFKVTYEIKGKTKFTESELSDFNKKVQSYYHTSESLSECYKLDGSITFSGSKFTDPDPLALSYCKYNGTWYLLGA